MPAEATTLPQLRTPQQLPSVEASFFDLQGFELMQRIAKAFVDTALVPKAYRGNLASCMIALNMAKRMNADPIFIMQNLYDVHGQPSWSSKFLIATINACGRYTSLKYEWRAEDKPESDEYGCRAWTTEKSTGERLNGVWVTWKMVRAEGWHSKSGSKWKTMPDQMFMYRAAAFWARTNAPELSMGLQTHEEVIDTIDAVAADDGTIRVDEAALRHGGQARPAREPRARRAQAASSVQDVDPDTGEVMTPASGAGKQTAEPEQASPAAAQPAAAAQTQPQPSDAPTYEQVAAKLRGAKAFDELDVAADLIRDVEHPDERDDLQYLYGQRREEMQAAQDAPAQSATTQHAADPQPQQTSAPGRRGGSRPQMNLE